MMYISKELKVKIVI